MKIGIILASLGFLVCLIYCAYPAQDPRLIFCDVGQGDGILITQGFNQALIDTGPDESILKCLNKHLPFWDKQLELLVLTHPDQDHIGGAAQILSRYQIGSLIMPELGSQSQIFHQLLSQLVGETQVQELIVAQKGQKLSLSSQISLQVLHPSSNVANSLLKKEEFSETILEDIFLNKEAISSDTNAGSIVIFSQIAQASVLLTADIGKVEETALIKQGLIDKVDILKAAHHGSKGSSSMEFLQRIQPENVVISSGKNNSYGHPHQEAMTRFEAVEAKILQTSLESDIVFSLDSRGKLRRLQTFSGWLLKNGVNLSCFNFFSKRQL